MRTVLHASVVLIATLLWAITASPGTIWVAAPTGDPILDHASIQAAVDGAEVDDVIQFDEGTYVLGTESDFIVVGDPEVKLVGHPNGTVIFGGDVLPIEDGSGDPYLGAEGSLLAASPRGFRLTGQEQVIRNIEFRGFRTAVMIGFPPFHESGGYVIEDCTFEEDMYGIVGYMESEEVFLLQNNDFINCTFPYNFDGYALHSRYNFVASPASDKIPVDGYTHHAGTLSAAAPGYSYFAEGGAPVTEHNVFEFNIVEEVGDGFQIIANGGGAVRNNLFRYSEFRNMGYFGTFAVVVNFGGTVDDNLFLGNSIDGSTFLGFLLWNIYGVMNGNIAVGNIFRNVYSAPVYLRGATNTILLYNRVEQGLEPQCEFIVDWSQNPSDGSSNLILLSSTVFPYPRGILFSNDNLVLYESGEPIVQDYGAGNEVISIEPQHDVTRLLNCASQITDTESVDDFKECVYEALDELFE